jgi:hypothetical protein
VQCLERRANEVDIAGLLGLANFLVFADTIVFGNQELDSVLPRSIFGRIFRAGLRWPLSAPGTIVVQTRIPCRLASVG